MSSFFDAVRKLNMGHVIEELDDELANVVSTATSTGKAATLTFTITVKPGKGNSDRATVAHQIKTKMPEFERPEDLMFIDGKTLTDRNPRQNELKLKVAANPTDAGTLKTANG